MKKSFGLLSIFSALFLISCSKETASKNKDGVTVTSTIRVQMAGMDSQISSYNEAAQFSIEGECEPVGMNIDIFKDNTKVKSILCEDDKTFSTSLSLVGTSLGAHTLQTTASARNSSGTVITTQDAFIVTMLQSAMPGVTVSPGSVSLLTSSADGSVSVPLSSLASSFNPTGAALSFVANSVKICNTSENSASACSGNANALGTVTVNGNNLVYALKSQNLGTTAATERFSYQVCLPVPNNSTCGSEIVTVNIQNRDSTLPNISALNSTATVLASNSSANVSVNLSSLVSTVNPSGASFSIPAMNICNTGENTGSACTGNVNALGTLSLSGNTITYTLKNVNNNSANERFGYKVCLTSNSNTCSSGIITVNIENRNTTQPDILAGAGAATVLKTSSTGEVLINTSSFVTTLNPANAAYTLDSNSLKVCNNNELIASACSGNVNALGTLSNSGNTITYSLKNLNSGSANERFAYKVCLNSNSSTCSSAIVSVTIQNRNTTTATIVANAVNANVLKTTSNGSVVVTNLAPTISNATPATFTLVSGSLIGCKASELTASSCSGIDNSLGTISQSGNTVTYVVKNLSSTGGSERYAYQVCLNAPNDGTCSSSIITFNIEARTGLTFTDLASGKLPALGIASNTETAPYTLRGSCFPDGTDSINLEVSVDDTHKVTSTASCSGGSFSKEINLRTLFAESLLTAKASLASNGASISAPIPVTPFVGFNNTPSIVNLNSTNYSLSGACSPKATNITFAKTSPSSGFADVTTTCGADGSFRIPASGDLNMNSLPNSSALGFTLTLATTPTSVVKNISISKNTSSVNFDSNVNTLAIETNFPTITNSNMPIYAFTGSCSPSNANLSITIDSVPTFSATGTCGSNGLFEIRKDLTSLANATAIPFKITLSGTNLTSISNIVNITKNSTATTVNPFATFGHLDPITTLNDSKSYPVSGICFPSGSTVKLEALVDGVVTQIAPNAPCSGTFSSTLDLMGFPNGTITLLATAVPDPSLMGPVAGPEPANQQIISKNVTVGADDPVQISITSPSIDSSKILFDSKVNFTISFSKPITTASFVDADLTYNTSTSRISSPLIKKDSAGLRWEVQIGRINTSIKSGKLSLSIAANKLFAAGSSTIQNAASNLAEVNFDVKDASLSFVIANKTISDAAKASFPVTGECSPSGAAIKITAVDTVTPQVVAPTVGTGTCNGSNFSINSNFSSFAEGKITITGTLSIPNQPTLGSDTATDFLSKATISPTSPVGVKIVAAPCILNCNSSTANDYDPTKIQKNQSFDFLIIFDRDITNSTLTFNATDLDFCAGCTITAPVTTVATDHKESTVDDPRDIWRVKVTNPLPAGTISLGVKASAITSAVGSVANSAGTALSVTYDTLAPSVSFASTLSEKITNAQATGNLTVNGACTPNNAVIVVYGKFNDADPSVSNPQVKSLATTTCTSSTYNTTTKKWDNGSWTIDVANLLNQIPQSKGASYLNGSSLTFTLGITAPSGKILDTVPSKVFRYENGDCDTSEECVLGRTQRFGFNEDQSTSSPNGTILNSELSYDSKISEKGKVVVFKTKHDYRSENIYTTINHDTKLFALDVASNSYKLISTKAEGDSTSPADYLYALSYGPGLSTSVIPSSRTVAISGDGTTNGDGKFVAFVAPHPDVTNLKTQTKPTIYVRDWKNKRTHMANIYKYNNLGVGPSYFTATATAYTIRSLSMSDAYPCGPSTGGNNDSTCVSVAFTTNMKLTSTSAAVGLKDDNTLDDIYYAKIDVSGDAAKASANNDIRRVSVRNTNTSATIGSASDPTITADGTKITFMSNDSLVSTSALDNSSPTNMNDCFIWDKNAAAGQSIKRITSKAPDPNNLTVSVAANGPSRDCKITRNGNYMTFQSLAIDLANGVSGSSSNYQIFWKRLLPTETQPVVISVDKDGNTVNSEILSDSNTLSADGTKLFFATKNTNMQSGSTAAAPTAFRAVLRTVSGTTGNLIQSRDILGTEEAFSNGVIAVHMAEANPLRFIMTMDKSTFTEHRLDTTDAGARIFYVLKNIFTTD